MDSNDQTKGKEAEEEEQGKLLASIEAESLRLETELKGLMRLYALMLFQRERKGELVRVEKKQKELNACLGELRRARDLWLEADKDEVTVVDSNEDRSGKVDLPDYGDNHWKWLISGGLFSGANKTREFIIGSLGATRKGGVETGMTQEWHLL